MNPRSLSLLDQAESAAIAVAPPLSGAADPAVVDCLRDGAHAIEVMVVGEDDLPLVDAAVGLCDAQGRALCSATMHSGLVRFEGLAPGSYRLTFPEWDRDAWSTLPERNAALAPAAAALAAPPWGALPDRPGAATPHTVLPGECLAELAYRFGFALATLRGAPQNAPLRQPGRSPYLLLPGELVHIPPRRPRFVPAQLDMRHVIRRHDVPELFQVRFLDWKGEPRRGLPCVVHVVSANGRPIPDCIRRLDDEGRLTCPIPPDASAVEVRLQAGVLVEPYLFQLGHIDPVESDSGLIGRALALGYGRHHDIAEHPEELLDRLREATANAATGQEAQAREAPDEAGMELKRRMAALYRS